MSDERTTEAEQIVRKIFELDAQYQGGVIKARNRDDFMRKHLYPIVENALDAAYEFRRDD
jgi:hypothetical protein